MYKSTIIEGFSGRYSITSEGEVIDNEHGNVLSKSIAAKGGDYKVNVFDGDRNTTRSVKYLVAEYFVPGRSELMNTPILLDGDRSNITEHNILWRPRWFAWRYSHQLTHPSLDDELGPIEAIGYDELFDSVRSAAIAYGLLIDDIVRSIIYSRPVFPTRQYFSLFM